MQTRKVDAATVRTLLTAAVAAPSIHNTQPWRFGLDPDTGVIRVRLDRTRPLPKADPRLRAQHLSVGAAVLNLRVAAEHLGWEPLVQLCPVPQDPDLVATVRLLRPAADARLPLRELYEEVERRHTSRMPFTGRPVPDPITYEMTAAARAEGAQLDVPDIIGTRRLLRLTQAAEARTSADPARADEERSWVRVPGTDGPYGIPVNALGARDASGRMPVRDFTGGLSVPRLAALRFERHAQVALLWTPYDWREDWLRAGQALERVLLTATRHGVRTSVLHQAMEWPDLRTATAGAKRRCRPQALIRFGYGTDGGRTPRAEPEPGPGPGPGVGGRGGGS
ncbi:Acg family FMN-binding oxidoreductase [Streptomyces aureus]|uniref:Acg family FMN-binding oxidoreductase n=1 Tax=Streptomyces aureus TaxID=193461 RepID=UPI000568B773|nr:aromatic ring-opening dioxygenase LigA [Streptomyces aureus]